MPHFYYLPKKIRGFTLVELMITISIVAIISAVGVATYSNAQKLGRDARRKQDLRSIALALEIFKQENGRYPCSGPGWTSSLSSSWLTDSNDSCPSGTNTNIAPKYINTIPKDPLNVAPNNYGYVSPANGLGTCPGGQVYVLAAGLENSSDQDRVGAAPHSVCGEVFSSPPYLPNTFFISRPE